MKPITKQEKQAIKLLVSLKGIESESELVEVLQKGRNKRNNAFFNPFYGRKLEIDRRVADILNFIGEIFVLIIWLFYFIATYAIRIGWRLSELFWFRNKIKRNVKVYRELQK